VVCGVALAKNEARVSLRDIPDRPGVMAVIFSRMAQRKIPVDMIVQNVGTDGRASVSFTVPQDELAETLTAAGEAVTELGAGSVEHGTNLSKVSAVGSGMKTHSGVAAQMFTDLAEAGVNLLMITTSDIKISVLVDRNQADKALQTVHEGFGLSKSQPGLEAGDPLPTASSEIARMPQSELEKYVAERLASMEDIVVSEVLLDADQSLVTLRSVPDVPGVAQKVFAANALAGVVVDIIVQNASRSGHATLSFTMPRSDLDTSLDVTKKVSAQWREAELSHERDIAVISVNGVGLRTHTGVGDRMFSALSQTGINVRMISTSEIRTSVVVDSASGAKAHECLKTAFGLK
jgi:aspartate kinase